MEKRLLIIFALVVVPFCFGAEILQSCTFDGPGSTPREIVTNCGFGAHPMNTWSYLPNGGHDGGGAISGHYALGAVDVFDAFWAVDLGAPNEVTLVYWEKFDLNPSSANGWNVKSVRIFSGDDYMAGMMSLWNNAQWQQGFFSSRTLTTTSSVTNVNTDDGYCTKTGNNVYSCPNGRASVNWVPGFGTSWHKVRIYVKIPAAGASDGITQLWIDDILIYSLTDLSPDLDVPYITEISFRPSDDFFGGYRVHSFNHYYDDITIFEGYVPPGTSSCVPDWHCSEWSICSAGTQIRTCTDSNGCGTTIGKPATSRSCQSCIPKEEICGNNIDEDCDGSDLSCTGITVDSTYSGYTIVSIDDGVYDARGGEATTWASGDSAAEPHWILFTFPQDIEMNQVTVYWAFNAFLGNYASSTELLVQYWDGSRYVTAATIANSAETEKSTAIFDTVSTARLRLYQPANMGSVTYPQVLWVAEVDYGNCANPSDTDCDGCINQSELMNYIAKWKSGKVMLTNLMEAIGSWKTGC